MNVTPNTIRLNFDFALSFFEGKQIQRELEKILEKLTDERYLALFLIVVTGFVIPNVSTQVGAYFTLFVLAYFIIISTDKRAAIQFLENRVNLTITMGFVVVVFLLWVFTATNIGNYFYGLHLNSVFDFNVINALRATTNIPVNPTIGPQVVFLIWGIAIPVVETLGFFGVGLYIFTKLLNLQIRWYATKERGFLKMLAVSVTTAAIASLYHATTRQYSDFALAVDFMFFFISSLIVFRFGRMFEAAVLHSVVNSAILSGGI